MARLGRLTPNRPYVQAGKPGVAGHIAPTRVATVQVTDWQTTTTPKTLGSLTWLTGDLIVVIGVTEDQAATLGTPTVAGLTFNPLGTANTAANSCWVHRWSALAASGGSGTISVARAGSVKAWGAAAWQYRSHGGVGLFPIAVAVNVKTTTIVATSDSSAIVELLADWGSGETSTAIWTP